MKFVEWNKCIQITSFSSFLFLVQWIFGFEYCSLQIDLNAFDICCTCIRIDSKPKKKKPLSITEKQTKQNQRNYFVIHWKKKFIEFFVSFFISMQSICMQSIRSVTVECYSFIMTIRLIFLIKNKQKKKANKRIFSRLNFFQLFSKEKQSETNGIKFKNLCN